MNEIYKIIWSKARNCYVVVSELAKRNTKGSGSHSVCMKTDRILSALLVSAYLAGGYGISVANAGGEEAAQTVHYYSVNSEETGNYNNDAATGTDTIAIGPNASATSEGSLAIGIGVTANDESGWGHVVAIGSGASATGSYAIALGHSAIAGVTADLGAGETIAIGEAANAAKDYGIAIGGHASVSEEFSVALGWGAKANQQNGTAIGNNSTVSAIYGTALGSGAEVKAEAGVAIGYSSVADRAAGRAGYDPSTKIASTQTSSAWKSTAGAVSVGSSAYTRQITGVAAGSEDTDAVNVAQLKAAVGSGGGGGATYTAGDGISIDTTDNKISVNAGDGLVFDSDGKIQINTGSDLEIDNDGKVQVKKNGAVEENNNSIVTGGTLYTEMRPAEDGTYVKTSNTTAANLKALDSQLKTTTTNLGTEVINRQIAVQEEVTARKDADTTLSDRIGTLETNGNYITTTNSVTQNLSALDTQVKTNADTIGANTDNIAMLQTKTQNITAEAGTTTIDGTLTADATTVSGLTVGTKDVTAALQTEGTVTDGNVGFVTGGTVRTAIEGLKTTTEGAYTRLDGSNLGNIAADKWGTALGTGTVTADDGNLVSGKTVYATTNALSERIGTLGTNGNYITTTNSVTQNLSALDTQVKTNAGAIGVNTDNIAMLQTKTQNITAEAGTTTISGAVTADSATVNGTLSAGSTTVSGLTVGTKDVTDALQTEGTVTDGNVGFVTGGMVHTAISGLDTRITANTNAIGTLAEDGNYIKASDNVSQNLNALDKQMKLTDSALDILGNISEATIEVMSAYIDIAEDHATKINTNTTDITALKAKTQNITAEAGTTTISGALTADSATVNGTLSAGATTVSGLTVGTKDVTAALQTEGTVTDGNVGFVTGGTVRTAIEGLKTTTEGAYTRLDGSNLGNIAADKWGTALGTGTVTADDGNLVSGRTVYGVTNALDTRITANTGAISTEVTARENADTALSERIGTLGTNGNYITTTNNVTQNLSALDTQLKATDEYAKGVERRTDAFITVMSDYVDIIEDNQKKTQNIAAVAGLTTINGALTADSATVNGTLSAGATTVSGLTVGTKDVTAALQTEGTVTDGNVGFVTGGTVRTAIEGLKTTTEGAYTRLDGSNLGNIAADKWGTALGTGMVTADDGNLVSGKTVYGVTNALDARITANAGAISTEITARENADTALGTRIDNEITARTAADTALSDRIGTLSADGSYITTTNNVAQNLSALDTQVKTNADTIGANTDNIAMLQTKTQNITAEAGTTTIDGTLTAGATTVSGLTVGTKDVTAALQTEGTVTDGNVGFVTGGTVHTAIEGLKTTTEGAYTRLDGSNLGNIAADKWGTALGTGTVTADDGNLVSGKTVYAITNALDTRITANTGAISTEITARENADTALGTRIDSEITARTAADTALSNRIGTIAKDGLIIKADKNIAENLTLIDTALQDQTGIAKDILDKKAATDASNVGKNAKAEDGSAADNSAAWGSALGTGAVESGNGKLVTGDTVYSEVRPDSDGEYVKKDKTTSANLKSLDVQVKENAGNIVKNADDISANAQNIATNSQNIETNTKNITTAQKTADDAQSAISVLATVAGIADMISYEGIVNLDDKIKELNNQNGEVKAQGEAHADEFIKGSTVYEYLNGKDGEDGNLTLGKNSTKVAIGKGSEAGTNSVALGNGSRVKDDVNPTKEVTESAAIGYQNTVSGDQSVALGSGNTVSGLQSVAIGYKNTVTGDHSGAIGDPNTVEGDNSWAFGNNNSIPGSNTIVLGNKNDVSGNNTFVLGSNVNTNAKNAVVLGDGSAGVDNAVSVGAPGNERPIKNVAPGTEATDAATVGQLQEVSQGAYNNAIYLNDSINRLDSKVNKVGAGAAALAALHPIEMDNKFGMGLGYGNYRNASSMAVGLFYRPKDNLMFSIGGSMGNGENMINAGISIALDRGFTSSKAVMARTIKVQGEALEEQRKANAEQEKKIHNLEAENAAIKEQNARLEARLAAIEARLGK